MEITLLEALAAIAIVALGALVQASIGFGLAMISAPLLVLIERDFVPGPMTAAALVLGIWMAQHERHAVITGNLRPAVAGRLLGTVPAALLLGSLSAAAFDLVFAALVMLAVGISLLHPHIRASRRNVFIATVASGFMGTISSIGGPPLALVYQNTKGAELRANLAVLFIIGCTLSLAALALIGRFGLAELGYSGILVIGLTLGVLISGPLKRYLDKRAIRPFLLALCLLSALVVMGRALLNW